MSGLRKFDDLIAQKVMGWEIWQNDWYTPWITEDQARTFKHYHGTWHPTGTATCSQTVWVECLKKAREMGYELTQKIDSEGRFHVNGDHPVAKRLLIVDHSLDIAVCRFAAALFDFEPPEPYGHNPKNYT